MMASTTRNIHVGLVMGKRWAISLKIFMVELNGLGLRS
jgi:hypothetical protein